MGANPAAGCNNKEEYAGPVLPLAPGGVTPPVAPEAANAATAAKGECKMCPTDPGAFAEDTGVEGEFEVGGEAELEPGLISGLEIGLCSGGGDGVCGLNRGLASLVLTWDAIISLYFSKSQIVTHLNNYFRFHVCLYIC